MMVILRILRKMDESDRNQKPLMGRGETNSSPEYIAANDTSSKEDVTNEIDLDLKRESNGSSKNTTSDDNSREDGGNSTSASACKTAISTPQSGLKFPLRINATSKSENLSRASDTIIKYSRASKKQKSSHAFLHGSNGQKNVPSQDNGTNMNLEVQELKSNIDVNTSLEEMNVIASPTGDVPKKEEVEIKREKRKQANRESGRRSRLRKEKEHEELKAIVNTLDIDVSTLTKQLRTLSEDCGVLNDEIGSLMEELVDKFGMEEVSDLYQRWRLQN